MSYKELPPYSGKHTQCPKCCGKLISLRYMKKTSGLNFLASAVLFPSIELPDEWLNRSCQDCEYRWVESPADKDTP